MRGKRKNHGGSALCRIGIDLLGSDIPPDELLDSILSFSRELDPSIRLTLFGTASLFEERRPANPNLLFYVVKEAISMDDPPLSAIRKKKDSSLCVGVNLLKEGHLEAFISAGNTGALMGYCKIKLEPLPNVERPALMTLLPTRKNEVAVLDVGANTSYRATHLIQFAAIGVAYQKSRGISLPKVGLLNIGSEAKKGTPELQMAYDELLHLSQKKNASYLFAGNIEGRDVFQGEIDVLVTDGFTGNVFLKTAEGIATVILEQLQSFSFEECSPHFKAVLMEMRQRLHYAEYPGAILCGIDQLVLKCHGNSTPQSFMSSILAASRLIRHGFLDAVKKELKGL